MRDGRRNKSSWGLWSNATLCLGEDVAVVMAYIYRGETVYPSCLTRVLCKIHYVIVFCSDSSMADISDSQCV